MPRAVTQHLFRCLQVAVYYVFSCFSIAPELHAWSTPWWRLPRRASGKEGGPPRYNWEGDMGVLALELFVFGTEMCSVLRWDRIVQAMNCNPSDTVDETIFAHWQWILSYSLHSDVGSAKSHSITPLPVEARDGSSGEFLYPCIQLTRGGAFKLKTNR